MANLREILKKKILQELYNDTESTHYDTVTNRKVKIFNDTIDFNKNTVKAEITSGKNKGLFTIVNLDNLVELNAKKMVAEYESGNYPPGAEFDSKAPWNEPADIEIKNFQLDDQSQQFHVELTNGQNFDVDYIDILDLYWKKHPGSFEEHTNQYGELDDKMDTAVIRKLESEKFDFSDYLLHESEKKEISSSDEYNIDFGD